MILFQHHFGTVTIRQRVSMMVVNGKQQKSISLQSVPECFSHVLQPSPPSLQAKADSTHGDSNGDGNPSFILFSAAFAIFEVSI